MTTFDVEIADLRREAGDFSGWARAGALTIAAFLAVFGVWAVAVPIAGAVIAPGIVVSDGRTQSLRHPSGGVVTDILVREGDEVAAGALIAVLDRTGKQASHTQIAARLAGLDLLIARLGAEQDGSAFDPDLEALVRQFPAYGRKLIASLLADQESEYAARARAHQAELAVLYRQGQAIAADRSGLVGEVAALDQQWASIDEDIRLRRSALRDGYGRAAQLREMERELARITGSRARAEGQLQAFDEQMAEIERRISALEAARLREISEALSTARSERLELADQLDAAAAEMARVEIRADAAGIVDKLLVNTIGSAVEPYATIAEIVPAEAPLLIEARVPPTEIDNVWVGQSAEVIFDGLSRQNLDPLPAEVVYVSPDTHVDERTQARHYTVRLNVARERLANLPPTLPGMPAQSYFLRDDHTLLQYLIRPLADSFSRAFR